MKKITFGQGVTPGLPPRIAETGTLVMLELHLGGLTATTEKLYGHLDKPGLTSLVPNSLIRLKDHFTGEITLVNTSFLVTAKEYKFVTIWTDLSLNGNFKGKSARMDTYVMGLGAEYQLEQSFWKFVDGDGVESIRVDYIYEEED